jgi:hypothetical protein
MYIIQMSKLNCKPISTLVMLSTASSFLMLGVKLCKLPGLKMFWAEESKQKKKTSRATIDGSDIVTWLSSMESMKQHSNIFDDAGWTGERVLQLYDEAPLIELGMLCECDRKYLLLQLARVRAAQRWAELKSDSSGAAAAPAKTKEARAPLRHQASIEMEPIIHQTNQTTVA